MNFHNHLDNKVLLKSLSPRTPNPPPTLVLQMCSHLIHEILSNLLSHPGRSLYRFFVSTWSPNLDTSGKRVIRQGFARVLLWEGWAFLLWKGICFSIHLDSSSFSLWGRSTHAWGDFCRKSGSPDISLGMSWSYNWEWPPTLLVLIPSHVEHFRLLEVYSQACRQMEAKQG